MVRLSDGRTVSGCPAKICKNMEGKEIAAGVYLKSKLFVDAYEEEPPVFAIASYLEDKTIAIDFMMHCVNR